MNITSLGEIIAQMNELIARGAECYFKFTCASCGVRQTSETPNAIHLHGYKCEECGNITTLNDIELNGSAGFMLVARKETE